jgi:hypothetical protein
MRKIAYNFACLCTGWRFKALNPKPSYPIPAREVEAAALANLRGSSSPGKLKHSQSNADSNVAVSYPKTKSIVSKQPIQ